jgi:uncharacterized cupin superfamily protein
MGKISKAETKRGTRYPAPHDKPCRDREWLVLGEAAGLTQFGVNRLTLKPGTWSSQRHWHTHEDEFVYVLEGEVTLVTNAGDELLSVGDAAGFRAGDPDGHCFQNRSAADVVLLVVGSRHVDDGGEYPDIDLRCPPGRYDAGFTFTRKDGSKV